MSYLNRVMSQVCNTCDKDLPESEYYLQDGYRLFKKCKSCIKNDRVEARKNKPKKSRCGFLRLPVETREGVIAALKDRRMKVTDIAEQWGLNYPNLAYWVRSGAVYENANI